MSELFKLKVDVVVEKAGDDNMNLGKYIFKGVMCERGDELSFDGKTYIVQRRLFREDGIVVIVAEDQRGEGITLA